jgi:hypothetical protein
MLRPILLKRTLTPGGPGSTKNLEYRHNLMSDVLGALIPTERRSMCEYCASEVGVVKRDLEQQRPRAYCAAARASRRVWPRSPRRARAVRCGHAPRARGALASDVCSNLSHVASFWSHSRPLRSYIRFASKADLTSRHSLSRSARKRHRRDNPLFAKPGSLGSGPTF